MVPIGTPCVTAASFPARTVRSLSLLATVLGRTTAASPRTSTCTPSRHHASDTTSAASRSSSSTGLGSVSCPRSTSSPTSPSVLDAASASSAGTGLQEPQHAACANVPSSTRPDPPSPMTSPLPTTPPLSPSSPLASSAARALSPSALDTGVRVVWTSLVRRAFFHDGWGGAERLVRLAALRTQLASDDLDALVRSEAARLRHAAPTLSLASAASLTPKLPLGTAKRERVLVFDGALPSPATDLLGEALPERSRTCYFQLVVPASAVERDVSMLEGGNALGQELAQAIGAKGSKGRRLEGAPRAVQGPLPLCFLYGGTGEHYFWRRRTMVAVPLARDHGIASVIIENPFYGHRRPPGQLGSTLNHVSDLFAMGTALMLETTALRQLLAPLGYGPFCFSGFSMGGFMAALAACTHPRSAGPAAAVPCMSGRSSAGVFTRGVLSRSLAWKVLEDCRSDALAIAEHLTLPPNFDALSPRESTRTLLSAVLDYFTDVGAFAAPARLDYCTLLSAEQDGYVPSPDHLALAELWRGSEIRRVDGKGHVSSFITAQPEMRAAIVSSIHRMLAAEGVALPTAEQKAQSVRAPWSSFFGTLLGSR